ncbi:IS200/IS605 family transposase [Streptosporangium sp. NPDC048047]|uniref:IS200/IS605 family transposase n=1 Tax=Streptosporangium sp. NPDC048047 TaxID=3155748 RepID=UPI0034299A5C
MARRVRTSPGAAYDLGYHVVWCPKYRRPVLGGRVEDRLEELICAKAAEHGWEIVTLEVMPDHVHLFIKPHPKNSPSYVADRFKGFTSHHLRGEFPHLRSRLPTLWSRSYFVATTGAVSAETVQRHIETQHERAPKGERRA